MKHFLSFCLLACLCAIPHIGLAQIPNDVILSLRNGDARGLATHLNTHIELYLNDKDDVYSKSQTEQILKKFFEQHQPSNLTIIHQSGKADHQYAIIQLETNDGNFQVSVLIRKINNKQVISQLQIENSEL